MAPKQKTVLITGCSAGGIGDSLAQEFHRRGLRVFATARSLPKIAHLKSMGLDTLALDVTDAASIATAVAHVSAATGGSLDILLNNSGSGYNAPITDVDLEAARALFDVNVLAVLAVTQAFVPLLLASEGVHGHGRGVVVNNTSALSVAPFPFQGVYAATKAAAASLTASMRQELKPFGIKVVEIKTGFVKTKFLDNASVPPLPEGSLYAKARAEVESSMRAETTKESDWMPVDKYARNVVGDLLGSSPAAVLFRGGSATIAWIVATFLPLGLFDAVLASLTGLPAIAKKLQAGESQGVKSGN